MAQATFQKAFFFSLDLKINKYGTDPNIQIFVRWVGIRFENLTFEYFYFFIFCTPGSLEFAH